MMEHRFSSEDKVERVALDEQEMEYLYDDGEYYPLHEHREFRADASDEGHAGRWRVLSDSPVEGDVEFYEGKPISVELPPSVELKVVETEPGLKGATVSNVTKPAKLDTGLGGQVPPFINQGERIRVSTSEGSYLERA